MCLILHSTSTCHKICQGSRRLLIYIHIVMLPSFKVIGLLAMEKNILKGPVKQKLYLIKMNRIYMSDKKYKTESITFFK